MSKYHVQRVFPDQTDLMRLVHQFRKHVFVDHEGYDTKYLTIKDSGEYDAIDHDATSHIILSEDKESKKIIGCIRMVPTAKRHLLQDLAGFYPGLVQQEYPQNYKTWDLSRLGIAPELEDSTRLKIEAGLLQAVFSQAMAEGITQIVSFAPADFVDTPPGASLEHSQLGETLRDGVFEVVGLSFPVSEHQVSALDISVD